jgi:hypothetical protein
LDAGFDAGEGFFRVARNEGKYRCGRELYSLIVFVGAFEREANEILMEQSFESFEFIVNLGLYGTGI